MRRALHSYSGGSGNEGALVLQKGDLINILEERPDGWALGKVDDRKGWFPLSYSEPVACSLPPPVISPRRPTTQQPQQTQTPPAQQQTLPHSPGSATSCSPPSTRSSASAPCVTAASSNTLSPRSSSPHPLSPRSLSPRSASSSSPRQHAISPTRTQPLPRPSNPPLLSPRSSTTARVRSATVMPSTSTGEHSAAPAPSAAAGSIPASLRRGGVLPRVHSSGPAASHHPHPQHQPHSNQHQSPRGLPHPPHMHQQHQSPRGGSAPPGSIPAVRATAVSTAAPTNQQDSSAGTHPAGTSTASTAPAGRPLPSHLFQLRTRATTAVVPQSVPTLSLSLSSIPPPLITTPTSQQQRQQLQGSHSAREARQPQRSALISPREPVTSAPPDSLPPPLVLPPPLAASLAASSTAIAGSGGASSASAVGGVGGAARPSSPNAGSSAAVGTKNELEENAQLFLASEAIAEMGIAHFADGPLVHSVSIAEFDLTEGNTIRTTYPPNAKFSNKEELSNLCFPEGAHLHHHDWTTLCLWDEEDGPLFGIAFFSKLEDDSLQRGAIQQSILLLGRLPFFHIYQKILNSALQRYFAKGRDNAILQQIYDAINSYELADFGDQEMITFRLWDCDWQFDKPSLSRDTDLGAGASLVELVKFLKHHTMHLRYSILNQERVLFSGAQVKASLVGNCCLAATLLTVPISGYSKGIAPYVSITDMSPLHRSSYVCGITNPLFEDKPTMWDTLISFTRKKDAFVFKPHIRLTTKDRKFIDHILKEIEKGGQDASSLERWVRQEFRRFNKEMLAAAMSGSLPKAADLSMPHFLERPLYASYRARKRTKVCTRLEHKIADRPEPDELVKKNILGEAPPVLKKKGSRIRHRRKTIYSALRKKNKDKDKI